MMETYWDTMYPPLKRPKARANLAMWLAEYTKTLPSIKDFQPTVKDTDVVKALVA